MGSESIAHEAEGLIVSAQDPGLSDLGTIPDQGYHVVFLDQALQCHTPSFRPGV